MMEILAMICFIFALIVLAATPFLPTLINQLYVNPKAVKECEELKTRIKELEVKLYLKTVECEHIKAARPTVKTIIYQAPEGTIDAVKLAMKVSHPDNGGKDTDFIKYRNLYTQLTKGRR